MPTTCVTWPAILKCTLRVMVANQAAVMPMRTVRAAAAWAAVASADGASLVVARLRELSPALARRVVHDWLRAAGISEVGFELVERVLAVVRSTGRPASCNMTGGWRVRRRAGVLFMDSQAGLAPSGREPSPRKGPEKG